MSQHTSWRVGGPAETFFVPSSLEDLSLFLHELDAGFPYSGSASARNLLVRDGGIRGVVISASRILQDLERSTTISSEPAPACPARSWPGSAFAGARPVGVLSRAYPAPLAARLAMNAGAHGGETWERVESVRTIDRSGEIHERAPGEYTVGYRSVSGPQNEWFIEATLRFEPDVPRARKI